MNKLYACIIGKDEGGRIREKEEQDVPPVLELSPFIEIADQFAYRIEAIEGGILFDVSGLENRIGTPSQIALSIAHEMDVRGVEGNLAVAANAATAELYARTKSGVTVIEDGEHQPLPLSMIGLDEDTLKVFHALGMRSTSDLREIPEDELIARYGREFRKTLDLIEQKGSHILTPNLKDNTVSWAYQLDFPVDDFEQLIFIVGHGFGKLLDEAGRIGYSSEEFEITLGLENKAEARYTIRLSFPTRDKAFWIKLAHFRIGNSPPEAAIVSLSLICRFARPRAIERGLFAATRPEPESLLLTVDKIKKVVGPDNVGVPALLNQRLPEAFELDHEKLPAGREHEEAGDVRPVLALSYFHPPIPANIRTSDGRLVYLSTQYFAGNVTEYGGAWLQSSQWWTQGFWQQMEWDVELDGRKIYRLARTQEGWFVTAGYD